MSDKPKVTPGRPGSARVEYFACREYVEAMLAKGYSVRMTYERMKEQGQVTCSYSAFCDYVRGGGKRLHSRGKKCPHRDMRTPPKTAPRVTSVSPDRLTDPRTIDIKTLI